MTNDSIALRKSRLLRLLDSTLLSLALWALFLVLGGAYMIGTLKYLEMNRVSNVKTEKLTTDTMTNLTKLIYGYDEARRRQMELGEQNNRMLRTMLKRSGLNTQEIKAITNPESPP